MVIYVILMWYLCWHVVYSGHGKRPKINGQYCAKGNIIWVQFIDGKVSVELHGDNSSFGVMYKPYDFNKKTGLVTIKTRYLHKDAYKSYPFVKHLWNLTYDMTYDRVYLNHPKAKKPIPLTKNLCLPSNYLRHQSELGNLNQKDFCSSKDQEKKGVEADIWFYSPDEGFVAIMEVPKEGSLRVHAKYELRDGPSDDLKLVWSETINNHTTVDVIPFMEFSTRIYYNTKLDKLNVSSTSSKDFWTFDPKNC
ncbi:hypothetical protein FOL47_009623 [Perkinsus chesapeaki]|uniref:Uncharacterized protein n=1 Tax=Perkinsus chesapeaki TaxID=330153 RepID=A0A7J6L781_PERCH|nr:hypothetical protein FOL47_009623 [Perkinsus chesapeaki]